MKRGDEWDCRQALKMSHILFFSGFLLVMAGGLVLCVSTAPRALAALPPGRCAVPTVGHP